MNRKAFKIIFLIITSIGVVTVISLWLVFHSFQDIVTKDKTTPIETSAITPSLLCAAWQGDVVAVKKFLASGVNPDSTDDDGVCEGRPNRDTNLSSSGDTPLMRAAGFGHIEVVKLLVENGVDINARDSEGNTAI